jgi:hypothetical protein
MSKAGEKQVSLIGDYCKIPRPVIEDMKKSFHFYDSTFDPNPFATARNEGRRDVVLRIEAMIRASKDRRLIRELLEQPEPEEQE